MRKHLREKKLYHKATYVFAVLLTVIGIVLFFYWAIRPRPAHLGMALLVLLLSWRVWKIAPLDVYQADPKKSSKSVRRVLISFPILIWIVFVFMSPLEMVFPSHMPWEYAWDVKKMKEEVPGRYDYFPDEIPAKAKKVVWKMYPGYLQGKAFKYLIFTADNAYIEAELERYGKDLTQGDAYTAFVYPLRHEMKPEGIKGMELYYLYKSKNPEEYPSATGIIVDRDKGRICYFFE